MRRDGPRLDWLDGLRGVAALQVVALHYVSAFLPGLDMPRPALASRPWETALGPTPLYFLVNGHAAVYLFFLLSGAALSYSFASAPFAVHRSLARRILRLGLPMAAAVLLGFLLLRAWPGAHVAAGAITGSRSWLGAGSPQPPTLRAAIHQILLEGMLAGYRGASYLPAWNYPFYRTPLSGLLNPPLWTLHAEFVGSLLVMALAAARAGLPRPLHGLLSAVALAGLSASPLGLFVLGHLIAPLLRRPAPGGRWEWLGWTLLGVGAAVGGGREWPFAKALLAHLPGPVGTPLSPYYFQSLLAELPVLAGVALSPSLRAFLARPALRWLGALSFSLYLVHCPILFTFVSALFLSVRAALPYAAAATLCSAAGLALSVGLAMGFERWIDRPAIRLSRLCSRAGWYKGPATAIPVAAGLEPALHASRSSPT